MVPPSTFNFVSVARLAALVPSTPVPWRCRSVRFVLVASFRKVADSRGVPMRFNPLSFGAVAIPATVVSESTASVVLKYPSISSRPATASHSAPRAASNAVHPGLVWFLVNVMGQNVSWALTDRH